MRTTRELELYEKMTSTCHSWDVYFCQLKRVKGDFKFQAVCEYIGTNDMIDVDKDSEDYFVVSYFKELDDDVAERFNLKKGLREIDTQYFTYCVFDTDRSRIYFLEV